MIVLIWSFAFLISNNFVAVNSNPLVMRLVSSSIPIANHAGQIIRDVMGKGELENVVHKGLQGYQTEADRRAHQLIVCSLMSQFPKIKVIGEEEGSVCNNDNDNLISEKDESVFTKECPKDLLDVDDDQVTIWVDPLDGTREYIKGFLDRVTVLIGIAVGNRAVAGVIHQPFYGYKEGENRGRTIWGVVGLGAYGHTPQQLPSDRLILTTTRWLSNNLVQEAIRSLKPDEVLSVGGGGYKILLLLENKAHACIFVTINSNRWDTCAPEAILNAAGGFFTDMFGNCYSYNKETDSQNKEGAFATARKEDHGKFLNLISDSVIKANFADPRQGV